MTTLIGGGTGPAEGSTATTVTPGAWHLTRVFEPLDDFPVNVGLLGKGSTVNKKALNAQVDAGAFGFKIHEDWGATPAVIDAALEVCEGTVGSRWPCTPTRSTNPASWRSTRAAFGEPLRSTSSMSKAPEAATPRT